MFISSFFSEHPGKQLETIPVVEYTEKSQEKQESRHVQLVREYGFHPRSKVQVVDGSLLPRKFEPFPSHMYGKPLEEIDQFIYEEVSKQVKNFFFPIYFFSCCIHIYLYHHIHILIARTTLAIDLNEYLCQLVHFQNIYIYWYDICLYVSIQQ